MKAAALVLSAAAFVAAAAAPAHAQLGALGKIKKGADTAITTKHKIDDVTFTEQEERQIGERVSQQLRLRYGVVQDREVTKYVSLLGGALAQSSTRPKLDWTFIVLDTDGVNAFAVPGGIVHVTRGLLGMVKSEAELAGVLGHEITHITEKHAIRFLQQSKAISAGTDLAAGGSATLIAKSSERLGHFFLDNEFSREDESQSDEVGTRLASKIGYAPLGLAQALKRLQERNSGRQEKNGLFASHPALKDRIANVEKLVSREKLSGSATGQARYARTIAFDAKPVGDVATTVAGASGLASGDKKKEDAKKKDESKSAEPKKSGLGVGTITSGSQQANSGQQTASAGTRGGAPVDRDAKGGSNPSLVVVKVTAAEIDAFKKGIA